MEDDESTKSDDFDCSIDDKQSDIESIDDKDIECQEMLSSRPSIPPLDLSVIESDSDFEAPCAPRVPEPAGEWGVASALMLAGVEGNVTEDNLADNIGIVGLNVLTNSHSS